jgi:hypothetical protein
VRFRLHPRIDTPGRPRLGIREAARAAREEPRKGAIVDELIGAGREDTERPDEGEIWRIQQLIVDDLRPSRKKDAREIAMSILGVRDTEQERLGSGKEDKDG